MVLQVGQAFEWDTLISLGDFYDMYAACKYVKDPRRLPSLKDELDKGRKECLDRLNKQVKAKRRKITLGNHDIRAYERLKEKAPELYSQCMKEDWLGFHSTGWEVTDYREKTKGGVLASFDDLKGVVDPAVLSSLQQGFYLSDFGVYDVQIVGPQVGAQLRRQAVLATLYSLIGMLVYLAVRFEWIYGVAAVITVFHDTLITIGAFSLTNKPISLTVIAAILTLIGYSNNDTIVVFDRIRENLKLMRREKLAEIVNRSINQTLSRTILTAGLTFLTVLALYLFGGEVLHGFSFALVIGILIGTYSSIAIAAPILVAYQDWRSTRSNSGLAAQGATGRNQTGSGRREKAKARA